MPLQPIEAIHLDIIKKGKGEANPFFDLAVNFQGACDEIWRSPLGQAFVKYLAAHAHPCKHIPCSDPIQAAHAAGRAEIVAFIVMTASPDFIPNLSQLTPTPTEQTNGKPNKRTKTGP